MDLAYYNRQSKRSITEHKATVVTQQQNGKSLQVGCLISGLS